MLETCRPDKPGAANLEASCHEESSQARKAALGRSHGMFGEITHQRPPPDPPAMAVATEAWKQELHWA